MTNRYYTKGVFTYGSGFFFSWVSFEDENPKTIDWKYLLSFEKYKKSDPKEHKLVVEPTWDKLIDVEFYSFFPDGRKFESTYRWNTLKPVVVDWLNNNTSGWAVNPHRANESDTASMTIFFSRRSDVLSFIKEFG